MLGGKIEKEANTINAYTIDNVCFLFERDTLRSKIYLDCDSLCASKGSRREGRKYCKLMDSLLPSALQPPHFRIGYLALRGFRLNRTCPSYYKVTSNTTELKNDSHFYAFYRYRTTLC